MPKHTHDIGKREERQIVKDLEKLGYRARRQPGSGNRDVSLQHDVVWLGAPARIRPSGEVYIESKYREKCGWRTLLSLMDGADILTVRDDGRRSDQDGQRYAFLSWDLLLRLVGEAATRDDLSALQAMDRQQVTSMGGHARAAKLSPERRSEIARNAAEARWNGEGDRRARIQSAHQNPKPKPAKRNRLQRRGFSKQKVKADE